MSLVNYATREITCKIVYYGPGRSGKTTNLHYIYGQVPADRKGQMVSLATQTDRTLFFDFLPIDLGSISGFSTRFQLYTVPGQVYYQTTRKLVLQGADGVVFVADSQARQLDENIESFQDLHANLAEHGVDARTTPLVIQYNKQDLPADLILSVSELDEQLNFRAVPSFPADALHGPGVFETLRAISEQVLRKLSAGSGGSSVHLDARLRFDSLVVGAGNRLAVAAARAVAEAPGVVYNPVFIYGSTGLGKTHLLNAIGHLAEALQPGIETEYLSLDEFVEQLHAAVSAGQMDAFSRRYERVALLLIDDAQFLTGQRETQAELLRLFERMQARGKQIALTSDRPPAEIPDVDERLISRLSGGLIVDVTAPDYETRVAILRANCEARNLDFQGGVLEELARFNFTNVRELQGALNRLVAHHTIGEEKAQQAQARERARTPMERPVGEFENFLEEVTSAVRHHVESWKARIREAAQYWKGEGYQTAVLERALTLPAAPDVAGLLATFTAAVEHLRTLERDATAVDPSLGSDPVFRDPERTAEAEDLLERALAGETPPGGPSPSFARDAFEVGASNQLAVHAADAVVAEPGRKYNPLVLHGPSGVGKTHLLNAIGNGLVARGGRRLVVACVHAQKFVDELIAAIQGGTIERWRARYRSVNALLIDDVQFVAGKERTQEEFFLLFNAIAGAGGQIVITSDRAPAEIGDLEARLRSRFEGGLVVPIQVPDRPLRERLFARFLSAAGRPADASLLGTLGETPVQSVREIIGVVNRLGAAADASGKRLTAQLARAELGLAEANPIGGLKLPSVGRDARDPAFLDCEKIVWEWPDVSARVIEDYR